MNLGALSGMVLDVGLVWVLIPEVSPLFNRRSGPDAEATIQPQATGGYSTDEANPTRRNPGLKNKWFYPVLDAPTLRAVPNRHSGGKPFLSRTRNRWYR